ncbi:MAG TPA: class I SAM-dependent methyltransferase [Terracidiphilus sp.]|nr:class I SAM-dependent methyltransferase [Terracidiphilus sp.]
MTQSFQQFDSDCSFEFAALDESKNYRAAILEDFGPYLTGRVLEVGAGVGQFSTELMRLSSVEHLTSIEPSASFCLNIRKSLPQLDLIEGTVADLPETAAFHAIFSSNVLEHIETDQDELIAYRHLLQQANGYLCLFVPARPEIYAPIDADFGHFRRYTRRELRNKLEIAGFQIVKLRYFNVTGYFAWWLSFCLLKKRSFDPKAVRFYDRLIFPWVHAFETHVAAPPFGQSLMAVAAAR